MAAYWQDILLCPVWWRGAELFLFDCCALIYLPGSPFYEPLHTSATWALYQQQMLKPKTVHCHNLAWNLSQKLGSEHYPLRPDAPLSVRALSVCILHLPDLCGTPCQALVSFCHSRPPLLLVNSKLICLPGNCVWIAWNIWQGTRFWQRVHFRSMGDLLY